MPLIKCENVSIGYEGQTVVKDLNFAIEKGDYNPTIKLCVSICRALNKTLDEIFWEYDY